jgi:hypothetical protein
MGPRWRGNLRALGIISFGGLWVAYQRKPKCVYFLLQSISIASDFPQVLCAVEKVQSLVGPRPTSGGHIPDPRAPIDQLQFLLGVRRIVSRSCGGNDFAAVNKHFATGRERFADYESKLESGIERSLSASPSLGSISSKHFFHSVSAANLCRQFRAGLKQQLDRSRIISGFAMPAMLGAVNGPAQGRAFEIFIFKFQ